MKEMGSLLPETCVPPSPSQDHLNVVIRLTQRNKLYILNHPLFKKKKKKKGAYVFKIQPLSYDLL